MEVILPWLNDICRDFSGEAIDTGKLSIHSVQVECALKLDDSIKVFLNTYSEFIDEYAPSKDPRRFESIPEITHKHEPS